MKSWNSKLISGDRESAIMKLVFTLLFSMLFPGEFVFSQSTFIPLNDDSYHYLERFEIKSGHISDELHFSVQPLLRRDAVRFLDSIAYDSILFSRTDQRIVDFLLTDNDEWSQDSIARSRKSFLKYFYRDKASLYQHRDDDFMLKVNPVFDFEIGTESKAENSLYTNTRGIELRGWVAKKIGYYFLLNENQARFPHYVRERTDSFDAVPGEGYFKEYKTDGVDFLSGQGYFDFTVARFITVQFGNDKNFMGNGIRSLALSGFSEDYLFLKLQLQVWKINYQCLYTDMITDFIRTGDHLLPKKYGAFHHASLNATKFLNIGVWESTIFHRNNGYEFQYLNPIIFYRSVEQMLGSPDNTMLGIDYRINMLRHVSVYGQFMIDDFNFQFSKDKKGYWGNKYSLQAGVKYIDAFTVSNLDLQFEWNHIRPYVYTHNDTIANYSHYNQPLAHPLGANVNEVVGVIRYQPVFPLTLQLRLTAALQGRDTLSSNWGADIFIPASEGTIETIYGNKVGQGVKTNLFLSELTATYMIRHNIFIDAAFIYRNETADLPGFSSSSVIFQAGVRMNIPKRSFQF